MIKRKRIYEAPSRHDGFRILVDRLWPRGISKARASVDLWLRDIAPSDPLRKWFSHEPERWKAFQAKYRSELRRKATLLKQIRKMEQDYGTVTLLFAAKDEKRNNAVALARILRLRRRPIPK